MLAVIESLVCLWICWHLIKRFGFVKFVVGGIILICVSFHSKCKVWEQRPDTVRQFKEPCQCGVPRIFQGAA